ncbi:hypothetical protein J2X04_001706 [Lysobacter niabensis]|uniref:Aspartyl/asparaginy/proline hydroxylase domain-containing protein n=1 Tax=Agrilutibacter niabensis TaxID=380628 RepID=A0ABU1VPE1_9GAMM|nr:aspartyl/asparaginyl beta-hydroxylase domain-containing protein [Lysobacter niabensis]MDR7099359.1 hypothetical protein [Lysobacter niabensis]
MSAVHDAAGLDLLAGIAAAARGDHGIACLRLMRMDEAGFAALQEDVLRLCGEAQPSHVNDEAHVSHWTRPRGEVAQYSMLNRSGRYEDYSDDHDRSRAGKQFAHGDRYPALAALIKAFPEAVNFRINVLGTRARLSPHQEAPLFALGEGECGVCARFHLPVLTSRGAELLLDDDVLHLHPGEIYFVNHGCVHAARNLDAERRVHMVWDMPLCRAAVSRMFGDEPLPAGLSRCLDEERAVPPLRHERMGAALRLPVAATFGHIVPTFCPSASSDLTATAGRQHTKHGHK